MEKEYLITRREFLKKRGMGMQSLLLTDRNLKIALSGEMDTIQQGRVLILKMPVRAEPKNYANMVRYYKGENLLPLSAKFFGVRKAITAPSNETIQTTDQTELYASNSFLYSVKRGIQII